MSNRISGPDIRNLQVGSWICVKSPKGPCVWLYRARTGPLYLGRDFQGREGYFDDREISKAVALWSRNEGWEYWLKVLDDGQVAPYVPGAPNPVRAPSRPRDEAPAEIPAPSQSIASAMSPTEQGVRTGVGVAHTIGGMVLSAFGGGSLVQPIGQAHEAWLGAAFPNSGVPA